jgi:hypothetical protein
MLKTDECYILVADNLRRVYLWKGLKSSVRSKFIGSMRSQEIRGQVGMHYAVVPLEEGEEDFEFIEFISQAGIVKEIDKNKGGGDLPFPYIFKPPIPPGDLALAGQSQAKRPITEQVIEKEPYCKHCGAELPEGESICHVCGRRVG